MFCLHNVIIISNVTTTISNSTINNSDIIVVELVADVSLVLYNLLSLLLFSSLISQSSSVSVLVFLLSQITSSSHSPVYHMIQQCSLTTLPLPPGSYISSQQPPTSPPLHSLIQHCTVHVDSITCAGLYSEVGMLLEHGHHYHHHTTHPGCVMSGGGRMRGGVVWMVSLICNSI